jgi:hypothetical protein
MDKVMKAEIEKILEELHDTILFSYQNIKDDKLYQKDVKVRLAHYSSSLTSLIIKWLEGKKQTEGYINLAMENCNQLITELVEELR